MSDKKQWRESFARRVEGLRSQWVKKFEQKLADVVAPAFGEISAFVGEHGFKTTSPLIQSDRRSFKFEMAENAYVLVTVMHGSIEEAVVKCEYFAPGADPGEFEVRAALGEVTKAWASERFQEALDTFVEAVDRSGEPEGSAALEDLELLSV
jgi:hypothetical protein